MNNIADILENNTDDEGVEDYNTIMGNDDEEGTLYPNMSIKIDKDQYSVFEIKRKYDRGKICMDPSFQRNFVWNGKQKSELIESVIMGIPLPLVYLAESRDGNLIVVDGRQRLTTFFEFLDNKFKLSKLNILKELNGYNFKMLEDKYSNYATTIEDYQLVVQVIKYPTPDRVRFDIFDRVNRGGTPLNKQEMRNALYQGNATKLLKDITESQNFYEATGGGISSKHMKDRYIALRAIAFCLLYNHQLVDENGKLVTYKSDIEDLLGKTMEYINRLNDVEVQKIKEQFDLVMKNIYETLGKDAFRIGEVSGRRRPISMTLFEVLYYLFCQLQGNVIDKKDMKNKISILMKDEEFLQALQHSVDSSYSVNNRFSKIIDLYREEVEA